MIAKPHQWPLTAVAAAALLGFWSSQAGALSLGRINVLSALGEPLKAEIDILDINAEEAASFSTKVAAPDIFKAAGLEYSSVMTSVRTSLNRRADGRSYILLSSNQRINDPFVDLIIETRWSSGRIVRDYTLLFDPPKLNATSAPAGNGLAAAPATSTPGAAGGTAPLPSSEKSAPVAASKPAANAATQTSAASTITVKAGDTAGQIAAQNKAPNLSLDQMLVALLRANPQAFIDQNVNRIKSGAVINLPDSAQAGSIAPDEAHQIIQAQSRDFNAYRQSLASHVPPTEVAPAERSASGKLEASVSDKKSPAPASDKLTLSKASVQGKNDEQKLAQAGNAQEIAQRTDELTRNINELDKLASAGQASPATPAASSQTPAAQPASAAKVVPLPAPAPTPQPSFIDTLLENPMLPLGAASMAILLAGLGWYRVRQRNKAQTGAEDELRESRLQPDSFFGISDVKSSDVRDNPPTGSSMLYSPSQLDAVDDFDPVAEAAVYMAYGRDQQAEDILKEALNDTPDRLSIHRKLLDIYAKRRDTKAFESIAILASDLTQASGTEWEGICALGQTVDPNNPLYQAAGSTTQAPSSQAAISEFPDFAAATNAMPLEPELPPASSAPAVDLALDLDGSAPASTPQDSIDSVVPQSTLDDLSNAMDFSLPELPTDRMPLASQSGVTDAPAPAQAPSSMLEFNLGDLSLELNEPAAATGAAVPSPAPDSLESKLALAEEYRAIGDDESARALIEEVIAAAADDIKAKAQRALNQL